MPDDNSLTVFVNEGLYIKSELEIFHELTKAGLGS